MPDKGEVIKAYRGEKIKIEEPKNYNIRVIKSRDIEILNATSDSKRDENIRITVESDDPYKKYLYRESQKPLTPDTRFPNNSRFTIRIPKKADKPIINLYSSLPDLNSSLKMPLKYFIDPQNQEPVKMFLFYPGVDNESLSSLPEGDTSYLNGINYTPVSDDDDSLLFSQELNTRLNITDGPVDIDSLDDEQCEHVVKEILGGNFEAQVDLEKIEKTEGVRLSALKKTVTTSTTASKDLYLNRKILKDFGFKGRFYIKTVKGKQYVVFRGYSGLRKWYTGTRYKITNPKVINLSAAGKIKSGLKGNAVTIMIVGAIDVGEWILSEEEDRQVEDLFVTLGMDAVKVVIGSIITAGLSALAISTIAASAPVCVVIGGTILLGVFVGFGINWLDNKIGATDYVKSKSCEAGSFLEDTWNDIVVEPLGQMYYQMEKMVENYYLRGINLRY